jgi:hypothetical protein
MRICLKNDKQYFLSQNSKDYFKKIIEELNLCNKDINKKFYYILYYKIFNIITFLKFLILINKGIRSDGHISDMTFECVNNMLLEFQSDNILGKIYHPIFFNYKHIRYGIIRADIKDSRAIIMFCVV